MSGSLISRLEKLEKKAGIHNTKVQVFGYEITPASFREILKSIDGKTTGLPGDDDA